VVSKLYRDLLEHGGRDGRPLSERTVHHVHRTLRKAFGDAVNVERLLSSNPVARATRPRSGSMERPRLWTVEELRAFLAVAADHRLGAFFRLAAYTGARRGELLNLRWSAVDLDAAEVTFAGSTAVIDGERVEGSTKGGRSRVVSLDAGTVAALRDHRKAQLAEQLAAREWWQEDDDLVFRGQDGAPIHPDTVTSLMRKLVAKSGVRPARLHDLRHLHATTLLLAGVPVHVVAARLGHADPAITLRGLRARPARASSRRRGCLRQGRRGVVPEDRVSKGVSRAIFGLDQELEKPPLTWGFAGGQGRGRTADLPIFSRTLVPTELPARGRACQRDPVSRGPDGI